MIQQAVRLKKAFSIWRRVLAIYRYVAGVLAIGLCLGGCLFNRHQDPLVFGAIMATNEVEPRLTATPGPIPTATTTPSIESVLTSAQQADTGCAVPPLLVGQHISVSGSYTETQTEAAGAMMCQIERNTCAYYHLVGNLNSSLIFKNEEEPPYDGEDILMHPAMLLPLSRLAELVNAEWQGQYKLRITDAYDSLLEHDLNQSDENRRISLHFEGRALDITTWPIAPEHFSRLCALAHCAGFDWVHYESDHCHVAVKAESLCLKCND